VVALGIIGGAVTLAAPAFANESYSVLRCQPLTYSKTSGWNLGAAPPWSEMVFNWASQLYNPNNSMEVFRCSVDENSSTPVSGVQISGWSAGCVTGTGQPQLQAYACVVPAAGGTGANCVLYEPVAGQSPDCSVGTKHFNAYFPSHVAGDALEIRVQMDVAYNGSTSAFWAYQSF